MRNLALLTGIFGFVITSVWAGNCPQTHFNQTIDMAREALALPHSPRLTYLPETTKPENDAFLCRMVSKTLVDTADSDDAMAFSAPDTNRLFRLLRCIDRELDGASLPSLRVAYVGNPRHRKKAQRIVESWDASFVFVAAPDTASGDGETMLAQCEVEDRNPDAI
ncbi:MAG: hypothetical protein KJO55_04970 [Gammaproteobacteria bacterium]|nr:hypothetical protein [Gammaproteobacteria bacterium]NND61148.1 hypothetical protein [Gammaproteobacteria bacterium]